MGEKDDYDSETPGSQMGSPVAAEEGGEEVGGGRWKSGERSEVQARSKLTSTAPKARSRSGEVATLDEVPRISLRVSSKLPSSPSSLLSSVITALARTSAYPGTTAAFAQTLASSLTPSKAEEGRRAEDSAIEIVRSSFSHFFLNPHSERASFA